MLIVGGGAAGITVAAELRRHRPGLSVSLVELSRSHSYQPGWTLVGAGVFRLAQTTRREETLIPKGVTPDSRAPWKPSTPTTTKLS